MFVGQILTRLVPQNPNSAALFNYESHKAATAFGTSRYMKSLIERTADSLHFAKNLLGWRRLVEFLVHAETSLVLFSSFVAAVQFLWLSQSHVAAHLSQKFVKPALGPVLTTLRIYLKLSCLYCLSTRLFFP